jgi:hypothetical protein
MGVRALQAGGGSSVQHGCESSHFLLLCLDHQEKEAKEASSLLIFTSKIDILTTLWEIYLLNIESLYESTQKYIFPSEK